LRERSCKTSAAAAAADVLAASPKGKRNKRRERIFPSQKKWKIYFFCSFVFLFFHFLTISLVIYN
jgi:hypothetical protein